jgi:hypothetical protein
MSEKEIDLEFLWNLNEPERFALLLATIWYITEGMTNGADVIADVAGKIMHDMKEGMENGGFGATGETAEKPQD